MRELEAATGVPRSTIHYYLRQGILPPAEKAARNSASYGEHHLRRLGAIARLRELGVQLPLTLLKRAAELMDRDVEPEVAIDLERAVVGAAPTGAPTRPMSAPELASAAEVPVAFVEQLIEARLLVPIPGDPPSFDGTDLRLVRLTQSLVEATGLAPAVATRISDTVRDLSRYEMELRNRAVAGRGDAESFELTLRIQEGVHLIHSYLFYRWRLHDIARLRRQEAEKGDAR